MSKSYLPTYSSDAEQSVLGALLVENNCFDDINLLLTESHFYLSAHKQIFIAIKTLLSSNKPADLVTVERFLSEKGYLEQCGGFAYLAEISKKTPSTANVIAYAEIVKNDAQARELLKLGKLLHDEASKINSKETLEALIEKTEKTLTDLTLNQLEEDTVVNLDEVLARVIDQMEASCKNNTAVTGVSFGIERLDNNTSGAQNGELIILAARPSMGKTALSLKFAESALNTQIDKPIQYYSLEMPAEQLLQRFIAMRSRVSMQKYRQAIHTNDEDMARFVEAFGYIKQHWDSRLLIDDSSYLTPQLLRSRVRRNIRKYGKPSVIIIDYLQLMSDPVYKDGKNRNLEISSISRSLKALAKEIDCPVIALSQLNRNLEQRSDKRPMQSDIRDSGSIEQDADVILFIYRDEVYHDNSDLVGVAEIIIGKQRNGPVGTVMASFKGEFSLFENIPEEEYRKFLQR